MPALPASLAQPCARPVTLPTADTSRADVERYWARDRVALARCGDSHAAVVGYYDDVRGRLAGARR